MNFELLIIVCTTSSPSAIRQLTIFFIHDASTHCGINKEDCYITMHFADKIAVDKYVRTIAGNATNNAVASSRLGLKTAFYTVVGK